MEQQEVAPTMDSTADHIGTRLRAAREASGRSLEDIATQTKVPLRLLDAIERGAVEELPVGPYATGFARTYARAVGMDGEAAAEEMRALLNTRSLGTVAATTYYEPAESHRVPPRGLAIAAAVIAALLLAGYLIWRSFAIAPDTPEPVTPPSETSAPAPAAAPTNTVAATPAVTVAADAPLRIVASDRVWFSLENAQGRGQFDLTLNPGEFYTVKPEQRGLFLRTGKPQALTLMVGEQRLPPVGAPDTVVSGIGLDAASLSRLASGLPAAPATPAAPVNGAAPVAPPR
jgi:cytoskeletal protein RodZ